MIYSLRGTLVYAEPGAAVVECAGVGYRCAISHNTQQQLPARGNEARLLTYMVVREDAVELFGFSTQRELDCFKLLISVNGVGPKAALTLLSDLTPDRLTLAVASGDDKTLTNSSGVGKKLAQRIVLELKDKLGDFSSSLTGIEKLAAASPVSLGPVSEAAAALVALGYTQSEAASALAKCDQTIGIEGMIKAALKLLARRM